VRLRLRSVRFVSLPFNDSPTSATVTASRQVADNAQADSHVRPSQLRGDRRCRLCRGDDRNDLEIDQIRPSSEPLIEHRPIRSLHDLEATSEIGRDPTADVIHASRSQPTLFAESPVNRNGVAVLEVFENHEKHDWR